MKTSYQNIMRDEVKQKKDSMVPLGNVNTFKCLTKELKYIEHLK